MGRDAQSGGTNVLRTDCTILVQPNKFRNERRRRRRPGSPVDSRSTRRWSALQFALTGGSVWAYHSFSLGALFDSLLGDLLAACGRQVEFNSPHNFNSEGEFNGNEE